jgi:hypothetical protein
LPLLRGFGTISITDGAPSEPLSTDALWGIRARGFLDTMGVSPGDACSRLRQHVTHGKPFFSSVSQSLTLTAKSDVRREPSTAIGLRCTVIALRHRQRCHLTETIE